FFQAEDGIRDFHVTGVQTCALPISRLPIPPLRRQAMVARRWGRQLRGSRLVLATCGRPCDGLILPPRDPNCEGGGVRKRLLAVRSEEHTSELQSRENLVCRLLLEKK